MSRKNCLLFLKIPLLFISAQLFAQIDIEKRTSELARPIFDLHYPDKEIKILAEKSIISNNRKFNLYEVSVFSKSGENILNLNSSLATFNNSSYELLLRDAVKFVSKFKGLELKILTDEMKYDLNNDMLSSQEESLTTFDNAEIISSGLLISREGESLVASFQDGSITIGHHQEMSKGSAKNVRVLLNKNEIILEGDAELNQPGILMQSDAIHYDLSKNKIIKSINSRIESRS